jgi:two-component system response regulator GlrR
LLKGTLAVIPATPVSPARILVVEDQDDVRRLLVTALGLEGYEVDEARSATDGLRRMQSGRYRLVVTDYAMPGGTGAWMLHEAMRRGLMNGALALIVTAHPDVQKVSNVEVLTKPLDLDEFLQQVRRLLTTERRARPRRGRPEGALSDGHVELVLYVSSASPASVEAIASVERLLERFDVSEVSLTVRDLARDAVAADEDGIAFTPTLVKRRPEPRMWVLGNLRDPEILEEVLHVCGVAPRR